MSACECMCMLRYVHTCMPRLIGESYVLMNVCTRERVQVYVTSLQGYLASPEERIFMIPWLPALWAGVVSHYSWIWHLLLGWDDAQTKLGTVFRTWHKCARTKVYQTIHIWANTKEISWLARHQDLRPFSVLSRTSNYPLWLRHWLPIAHCLRSMSRDITLRGCIG